MWTRKACSVLAAAAFAKLGGDEGEEASSAAGEGELVAVEGFGVFGVFGF